MGIGAVVLNPALDKYYYLPEIQLGGLNRVQKVKRNISGKGINVAKALQKIGLDSLVLGCAGGEDGRLIRRELKKLGIPEHLVEIAGATRCNLKLVSGSGEEQEITEINEPGPEILPAELAIVEKIIINKAKGLGFLTLSGSLPRGIPDGFYAGVIESLRPCGVKIFLDADREALKKGIQAGPFLVKPNRREAEELLGIRLQGRADFKTAARCILAQNINYVVISDGPQGALFAGEGRFLWATTPPVSTGSPIGCGDALLAGIVSGFYWQHSMKKTAVMATALAAAAAGVEGTAFPGRKAVERMQAKVKVEEI